MWEVIPQTPSSQFPAYIDTMPLQAFIKDLQFTSVYRAIHQCSVDINRMKCYVHGKRVTTVKELDDLLQYYEYPMDESMMMYQLCTQNSLAYVCEKSKSLIPKHVHLGSGTKSHILKIMHGKVLIRKIFRCFEIEDEGSVDTHVLRITIEVDIVHGQVTMLFHLKPKVS
tara:strand:- start:184 stop:690 length:507 start_codon:yes stop_codon:yes gene_type:complete